MWEVEHDRIDISESIDTTETDVPREFIICH